MEIRPVRRTQCLRPNPIAIGTTAADFVLPDAFGKYHQLSDYAYKPTMLDAFISNRCPFVVLIREALAGFGKEYSAKGLQIIAINSNDDATHP